MKWANYRPAAREIAWALLAVAFVYVLHCKFQVFEVSDSGVAVDFARNLNESFASTNLTDLFVWAAAYMMIRFVWKHDTSFDGWSAALAALFSVSYVLANNYVVYPYGNLTFLTENWYQTFLGWFCILGFFGLFYFCIRAILILVQKHCNALVRKWSDLIVARRFLPISFLVILLCWLPWLLMSYPGSFCWDAQWQLRQFFGDTVLTAHHPPLSTYIMGALLIIGEFYVDANFGAFLYLLLQSCVGAWVFSFGVEKLYAAGVRLRYCALFIAFYALSPVWGCSAQWYEKDLLYAEVATLFLIILVDIVVKKECSVKDAVVLTTVGILASLLRNNGIYPVALTLLVLVFYLSKHFRRITWLSFVSTVAVYVCFTNLIYPLALHIEDGSIREALSVPFQQTARYVAEHGDEVTENEKIIIDGVLDYDSLPEAYEPWTSNYVKDQYKEDASKLPEYFRVWFDMGRKHPETYASALLAGSHGYLAPVRTNIEAYIQTNYGSYPFLAQLGVQSTSDELLAQVFSSIRQIGKDAPLIKYLAMPGMYTWIVVACAMIFLKNREYGYLIILVPELVNILVCIASPLPNAIRYELPVVAAAPLLIGWTFLLTYARTAVCPLEDQSVGREPNGSPSATRAREETIDTAQTACFAAELKASPREKLHDSEPMGETGGGCQALLHTTMPCIGRVGTGPPFARKSIRHEALELAPCLQAYPAIPNQSNLTRRPTSAGRRSGGSQDAIWTWC